MIDLELYMKLLVHRRDVFAAQQLDGSYRPVRSEFTWCDLEEHLAGVTTYGTYVLDTDSTVKYVCFDLDTPDPEALLLLQIEVERLVRGHEKCLLLERSAGEHDGWHLWLFLDRPLPARQVRAWLAAEFSWPHQEDAPLDLFPKQDYV